MVRMDCGRLTVVNQLAQQTLEALQYLEGGMRAAEIFAAARGGERPVRFVGEQPLDLARAADSRAASKPPHSQAFR
jgi:hypothetical protein